LNWPFTKVI